jgi:Ni/Fe-hydrogenase 1 B-type cytochrome subunit
MTSISPPAVQNRIPLVNVYVWEWPVRITHWLTAISIWVLSVTGIYMAFPTFFTHGSATELFVMGYTKLIHYYAAIVFTLSVLARIAWMFMGNRFSRWDCFIPVSKTRLKGFGPTLRYYLFQLRLPPGFVGHNPLAGLTYTFLYLAFLVQIATGLAIYAASAAYDSPVKLFAGLLPLLGGLQTARWIHHVIMWMIWAFFVHHVYSAILMSQVEPTATVESIFSGHKFVPKEDVVTPGRRFYAECRHGKNPA